MAPADVRRFACYLNDLTESSHVKADSSEADLTAAQIDFADTQELLKRFETDERLRDVLMDPTEQTLQSTLQTVQEELKAVESKAIAAYIDQYQPLNELHTQIYECDGELANVEGRLGHFDEELSTVNKEIQTLEEDSDRLAVMLRNRMAAASSLAHWLQDTTVPPELVYAVRDGDLGDAGTYSKTLHTLQAKVENMHAFVGHEKLQAYPALQNVQGLEATAVDRVRAFLLERVASLKPGAGGGASNATIRRQSLLAFAAYPAFLRAHAPAAYRSVLQRYCEDHRAHLFASVKAYLAGLAAATQRRERPALVTAAELAGGGFNARLGNMFLPSGGGDDHLADFELGSRAEDLLHPDFSRWPAQALRAGGGSGSGGGSRGLKLYSPIALQSLGKRKVAQEAAFKAAVHLLCDAAAGEFTFLEDFFSAEAAKVFDECWRPVLAMVHAELDSQLAQCPDVIAVLVMTRVVGHAQLQMAHARVPALQPFLDSLGLMLWPHFSRLIREHISAVTVDKANTKARALKPPTPAVIAPVRRWAQLFVSIAKLNAEYSDSQIHNNLEELARALQTLLYRIRLLFTKPVYGAVFHILNVRHIIAVAHAAYAAPICTLLSSEVLPRNAGGLGADAMAICKTFERDLEIVEAQFKEECLGSHVKGLAAYVAQAQALTQAGRAPSELAASLGDATKARKIMQDFKDRWKPMVGIIQREVSAHFAASDECARELTRATLEELYRKYKDFAAILASQGGDFEAAAHEGPSLQTLAYELRELVR